MVMPCVICWCELRGLGGDGPGTRFRSDSQPWLELAVCEECLQEQRGKGTVLVGRSSVSMSAPSYEVF